MQFHNNHDKPPPSSLPLPRALRPLSGHGETFPRNCFQLVAKRAKNAPPPSATPPLVQAMPTSSVRTRRAPSRYSRDARVYSINDYGHAMIRLHPRPGPPPPSPPARNTQPRRKNLFARFFFTCLRMVPTLPCGVAHSMPAGPTAHPKRPRVGTAIQGRTAAVS